LEGNKQYREAVGRYIAEWQIAPGHPVTQNSLHSTHNVPYTA